MEFQFYKMKRDLEMDGGNGYTTVSMYFISLNSALQIAKMVHFLLCAFYHNKDKLLQGRCYYPTCMLSCVRLFATLWTEACQSPLFTGLCQQEYWSAWGSSRPGSDFSCGSCNRGQFFTAGAPREGLLFGSVATEA